MSKDYLKEDFFIAADGTNLFEQNTNEKVKFLCITDDEKREQEKEKAKKKPKRSKRSSNEPKTAKAVVGFDTNIPLWQEHVTLKWKFSAMFDNYNNSIELKNYIRSLIKEAIQKWGDAAPVTFVETIGDFDFTISMTGDNCNPSGCSLAAAFFPNTNQNEVFLFPKMFKLNRFKQVDTIVHEMGHIFGLRHYFAKEKEGQWRSEIFGHHDPLTIMNYGDLSTLTNQDKADLKRLYNLVWSGKLKEINGMPVVLFNSHTQSTA